MTTTQPEMKNYVGTKYLKARPMTLGAYNEYQGWIIPADQNPEDEGYLVEYSDGGKPNHPDHVGYISWSPKGVFERSYRELSSNMDFSQALMALKAGQRVQRIGWNAADQWLSVSNLNKADVKAANFWSPHNRDYAEQNGGSAIVPPCITIKNAQGEIQMGWVPSQGDLFANDWTVVI